MSEKTKYLLDESQMPKSWYNIQADLPKQLPAVLHPGTMEPISPQDLEPLFPMDLIMQEVSLEREIEIPQPVQDIYQRDLLRRYFLLRIDLRRLHYDLLLMDLFQRMLILHGELLIHRYLR